MSFKIVIPARLGSSRLPGKPLLDILGKPMIVHVCERALESGGEVFVATDDDRIIRAVESLRVTALMTREDHQSGTERISEVAERLSWPDQELIVNLQGDEPLIQPNLIRQLAAALKSQTRAEVATLAAPVHRAEEVFDPHAVKVVMDHQGYALYFSRAPIPWDRQTFQTKRDVLPSAPLWFRHIGIYAYTGGFLRRYVSWPSSELERVEALEQLRILYQGEALKVVVVDSAPPAGVDTPADLERVKALFAMAPF